MDIAGLTKDLVLFLAPYLPYLLKAGEKAAEEAGKQLGGDAWDRAKSLWGRIRPKVETKPAAQEAVQDVAENPDDEDTLAALRQQLKKLLADDQILAQEVAALWSQTQRDGISVVASGQRSVAVGGSVADSTIITGDRNVAQRGKYNVNIGEAKGMAIGDDAQVDILGEKD